MPAKRKRSRKTVVARGVGSFRDHGSADARIELPATDQGRVLALDRGERIVGVLRLARPVARKGARASVRVSDSLGRLLLEQNVAVPPGRGGLKELPLELDVPGVLAQRHFIHAEIRPADGAAQSAAADVLFRPPVAWDDYICGMWQRHNAARLGHLQQMHMSWSQWTASMSHMPGHFIDANYRYYVERGACWAVSAYHRWMPDREKTYYYKQVKAAFLKDRTDVRLLEREPCLSNHVTRDQIAWLLGHEALMHRDHRPMFYSVADEPGIANQAAPFDFCFSPSCVAAFTDWLKPRYRTLAALNRQWGTDHRNWDRVRGETTDAVLARTDENYSAWCDHKDFMDDVQMSAYALSKSAMRQHDPTGRIGMGGAQGPAAVGAWDFWKFSRVFDVLEAYYIGNNYELMRSFSDVIPIHCSFGDTDAERHLIWYLFCHGDRGLLVWDDGAKYVNDTGAYSKRAKDFTPLYAELTGGIGKLRIASQRTDDPIALYHSQANLRVHWVNEVRTTGEDWVLRDSSAERIKSRYFWLRESWVKVIEDNGLQYRFLAPAQVTAGELRPFKAKSGEGFKVLILPEILALSDAEAVAIRRFVTAGGTVIADRMPGEFDEHGKRREQSPLADLFRRRGKAKAVLLKADLFDYHQDRLTRNGEADVKARIGRMLTRAVSGDRATPRVTGPDGKPVTGVETTVWRNGHMELIALHRNPQLRVHELGQQIYTSKRKFETRVKLTVRRDRRTVWYDVRRGGKLATGRRVTVTLPPFEPVILAAFDAPVPPFSATVRSGVLRIRPGRPRAMQQAAYHLDFIGPDGTERLVYRENVLVPAKGVAAALPVALNDDKGRWTVRIREVATGASQDIEFKVH